MNHSPSRIDSKEARSKIITTLIDCFSELNKYTSSHPKTELACHQEKTRHFSYYSWLIQHIDNVLQEDNIFRCSKELPELPAPTYSTSVTDLETIQRIHVMSHAWRESDQALQEATIIHREFMLEQAHMNNTSFSRIRNVDHITDMGYSLNRVSPIFGEQRTPAQSTNPRNPTSTPRHNVGHINKNSVPQGADTQQGGRASPYDPDRSVENHLQGQTIGSNNQTRGAQAPTTNRNNTNNQIQFQNTQRCVPSTTGPTGQCDNRYSQPSNKGPGKKASSHINTQPSISDIFAQTSAYPQSRNLGTGHPKLFCTACGEYDHWRKDCPYNCHCDNCDSDSHATHMCRAPPNLLLPHPHSLLFAFIVVVQSIGRWSAETILETTERKVMYPVQHPVGTPETNNVKLPQRLMEVHKSPMLGPETVTDLVTTCRDLRLADNNSNSHNAPHRANQIITRVIFLTGIIGTVINRDKHDSMKSRIKCILHITLPLPLHSLQALTFLVVLLCSLQKCNPVHSRFLQHNKNLKLMFTKS